MSQTLFCFRQIIFLKQKLKCIEANIKIFLGSRESSYWNFSRQRLLKEIKILKNFKWFQLKVCNQKQLAELQIMLFSQNIWAINQQKMHKIWLIPQGSLSQPNGRASRISVFPPICDHIDKHFCEYFCLLCGFPNIVFCF